MTDATLLEDRGVLRLTGPDRVAFLQGLVSNDVSRASPSRALWAAFLTPQGKWLHDFFLVAAGEALLLETEAARLADLQRRLTLYKLRSKVELVDASADYAVAAVWGPGALRASAGLALGPAALASQPVGLGLAALGLAQRDPVYPQRTPDEHALAQEPRVVVPEAVEPGAARTGQVERFALVEDVLLELLPVLVATRQYPFHQAVEVRGLSRGRQAGSE